MSYVCLLVLTVFNLHVVISAISAIIFFFSKCDRKSQPLRQTLVVYCKPQAKSQPGNVQNVMFYYLKVRAIIFYCLKMQWYHTVFVWSTSFSALFLGKSELSHMLRSTEYFDVSCNLWVGSPWAITDLYLVTEIFTVFMRGAYSLLILCWTNPLILMWNWNIVTNYCLLLLVIMQLITTQPVQLINLTQFGPKSQGLLR